jgi:hypothetical protein
MPDVRRVLLGGLIDYAGLFPPAQLPMDGAVAGYRAAAAGDQAWLLNRFVCPAARLGELSDLLDAGESWPVAVTVDLADVGGVTAREDALALDAAEVRVPPGTGAEAIRGLGSLRIGRCFVEVALDDSRDDLLDAVAREGLAAKVRCGGAVPAPPPAQLAGFIAGCAARDIAWKATAGLHHPFRDVDPATGEERHGFLNLLAAAGLAAGGADEGDLAEALAESDPDALALDESGLHWRDRVVGPEARTRFDGYGSCSFDEPVDDLVALGVLAREAARSG